MSSQVKMSPPHISNMPSGQPNPPQPPNYNYNQGSQYPQDPQYPQGPNPQNVSTVAQNYRDQLFAQCAMGNHERKTEYGVCGIITAIACFPCGLICLFSDKTEKCSRCGVSLDSRK